MQIFRLLFLELRRVSSFALLSDGFNTLRSLRSLRSHVTEVSSGMSANVSEDEANVDVAACAPGPPGPPGPPPAQLRPRASPLPPPTQQAVITLQPHDYSNIQQPASTQMPSGGMATGRVRNRKKETV